MNQDINSIIHAVKIAAKRLKKHIPNKTHMQLLDLATYAFSGRKDFHALSSEAKSDESESHVSGLSTDVDGNESGTMIEPILKHGNWSYYPHLEAMVLENTPWSPYAVYLKHLESSNAFTDTLLHLQSKRKERFDGDRDWSEMSSAFEIGSMLILLDKISRYYFDLPVQSLYIRHSYKIDWSEALKNK